MKRYVDDIMIILGAACVVTGCFFIGVAVGLIAAGVALVGLAALWHFGGGDSS